MVDYVNQIFTEDAQSLCRRLPPETVDIVLTDPPYNIAFGKYDGYADKMPDEDYVELLRELQKFRKVVLIQYPEEMFRLVVPALGYPDHVGAWCYNSNLPRRFRLICYFGCKPDYTRLTQPYKNPTDKRIQAIIDNGSPGGSLYEWWDDIQLVKNVSKSPTSHPCPVPVRLMERIILLTTVPNETVFDPFMGGGTTAIAAVRTGRNYIGSEINPAYAEMARQCVAQAQPPLMT